MASPPLRRWAWPAAAAVAAAFIVALALHGERPGLTGFEAAGLLAEVPIERVSEVEVTAAAGPRRFRRTSDGRWTDGSVDRTPEIDEGLKFLRVTRPERVLTGDEIGAGGVRGLGLDPPAVTVTARIDRAPPVVVRFGARNPLGVARYARVGDRPEVVLVPRHVAEAWDRVAAGL